MPYVGKPMKLVTVCFTGDEKAILDELEPATSGLQSRHSRTEAPAKVPSPASI